MNVPATALRILSAALRGLAAPFMGAAWLLVQITKPILWCSRQCLERAREWDPRLWERDGDPRSDNRERRP
ncbi:hypothetical protein [Methylobacterium radiodurans]|uniref:Uncharacterized protein n=1 Tax=Methylobacterium radiodurans TaxID=2202828 RepID=A0A2U8VQ44_9HYPH|nr:hypothetical protein [Methylobacterium radiodurans]AWN35757.1 hypothetical protein DK427_08370 [Methylobacterium radiodurans]